MAAFSLGESFFFVLTLPITVPLALTWVAIDYTVEALKKLKKLVYENGYGKMWERIQRILETRLENICVEAFTKFIEAVIKRGYKMLDAIQMVEEDGKIPNFDDIPHVN